MADSKRSFVFTSEHKNHPSTYIADYTGDPFTSVDGRFVGADGFVVPSNFEEFELRYPNYVQNWLCKKLHKTPYDPIVEDWVSKMGLHMRSMPDTSKVAQRGFKDVIDAFNPWGAYGCSAKRFFNYVNICLLNKYISELSKNKKDALNQPSVPYERDQDEMNGLELHQSRHEDWIREHSLVPSEEDSRETIYKTIFVSSFMSFLSTSAPHLVPVAQAIMDEDKVDNITTKLSISSSEYQKAKKELVCLGERFKIGLLG